MLLVLGAAREAGSSWPSRWKGKWNHLHFNEACPCSVSKMLLLPAASERAPSLRFELTEVGVFLANLVSFFAADLGQCWCWWGCRTSWSSWKNSETKPLYHTLLVYLSFCHISSFIFIKGAPGKDGADGKEGNKGATVSLLVLFFVGVLFYVEPR